jgi:predicted membrane protein
MRWKTHATEFTGLLRMNIDMPAIHATTANVELIFLEAKLILTYGRSVLDAALAEKIASLGSWFRGLRIENWMKSIVIIKPKTCFYGLCCLVRNRSGIRT